MFKRAKKRMQYALQAYTREIQRPEPGKKLPRDLCGRPLLPEVHLPLFRDARALRDRLRPRNHLPGAKKLDFNFQNPPKPFQSLAFLQKRSFYDFLQQFPRSKSRKNEKFTEKTLAPLPRGKRVEIHR